MAARLRERYQKDVAPQIAREFGIGNPMAVPRLEKVVINMGMGEAIANQKILDTAADELRAITGQKPVITKAKKSIASFKLRQGMPIGVVDKLRGMNITIVTTARNDEQSRALLKALGMPFRT